MIKISNNEALGVVKSVLSFSKGNTVLRLIEKGLFPHPIQNLVWAIHDTI
jgi:hypothetical protein